MKTTNQASQSRRKLNRALWTAQWLLALLFLFAGVMKLVLPIAALTQQMPLPGALLRFIGVAETLGALGLVLPGLFKTARYLTPLAAAGLGIIMIGAVTLTWAAAGAVQAALPFAVGCVLLFIISGRRVDFAASRSTIYQNAVEA